MVKDLPANAGNARDAGSVPGLRRSARVGNATHFGILAWKIPQTEKPWEVRVHGVAKSQT